MPHTTIRTFAPLTVLLLAACGSPDGTSDASTDATPAATDGTTALDATRDTSVPDTAAPDAARDTAVPDTATPDAAVIDAPADALPDASTDAARDALVDASADTLLDAARDVAPDALPDVVPDVNAPPVANAGPDQVMLARRRTTLAGSGSDPDGADGAAVTYAWTQTAGPPAVLSDATSATPSFWVRYGGTYVFTLRVSDGIASTTDTVSVFAHDVNGGEHTVALKPDGTLWAWGENGEGAVGDGTNTSRSTPVRVCDTGATDCSAHPFTGVIAISTGRSHTLALKSDGSVWSWGDDRDSQLGQGDGTDLAAHTTPHPVCAVGETTPCTHFLTGVVGIAAGYWHSTALLADGTVVTWGDNSYGELGQGTAGAQSAYPVVVCGEAATGTCTVATGNVLGAIERLAAGGDGHTLALHGGQLSGWGANKNGQIGEGAVHREQRVPARVCASGGTETCTSFLSGVTEMDAWSSHSLAITSDGALWGWGSNDYGQLSTVATSATGCLNSPCYNAPVRVCTSGDSPCTTPFTGPTMVAAARRFSVALKNGEVWSWGVNDIGELGRGNDSDPAGMGRVCAAGQTAPCTAFLSGIVGVSTGNFHAVALDASGALWAWGSNTAGQLGDGTMENRNVPVRVTGY